MVYRNNRGRRYKEHRIHQLPYGVTHIKAGDQHRKQACTRKATTTREPTATKCCWSREELHRKWSHCTGRAHGKSLTASCGYARGPKVCSKVVWIFSKGRYPRTTTPYPRSLHQTILESTDKQTPKCKVQLGPGEIIHLPEILSVGEVTREGNWLRRLLAARL